MRIWKYAIKPVGVTELELPEGTEILSASYIDGVFYIWCKVPENGEPQTFTLLTVQTGDELPKGMRFIDTVVLRRQGHEPYVAHVFVLEK